MYQHGLPEVCIVFISLLWHWMVALQVCGTPLKACQPLSFQEHLILVTELLRANLYEFQKYNRKQLGQEPYFTLPRMQKIAIQVCNEHTNHCLLCVPTVNIRSVTSPHPCLSTPCGLTK